MNNWAERGKLIWGCDGSCCTQGQWSAYVCVHVICTQTHTHSVISEIIGHCLCSVVPSNELVCCSIGNMMQSYTVIQRFLHKFLCLWLSVDQAEGHVTRTDEGSLSLKRQFCFRLFVMYIDFCLNRTSRAFRVCKNSLCLCVCVSAAKNIE